MIKAMTNAFRGGHTAIDGPSPVPATGIAGRVEAQSQAEVGKPSPNRLGLAVPGTIATDIRISCEPDVVLAGTLYLPAGHGKGPYPLAVMIQGNGPNKRGRFSELIKPLSADGIAALEYDKRGVG